MGDAVLFEPGEAIPCDGTLVTLDGAMGESDAIKKLLYHGGIILRKGDSRY